MYMQQFRLGGRLVLCLMCLCSAHFCSCCSLLMLLCHFCVWDTETACDVTDRHRRSSSSLPATTHQPVRRHHSKQRTPRVHPIHSFIHTSRHPFHSFIHSCIHSTIADRALSLLGVILLLLLFYVHRAAHDGARRRRRRHEHLTPPRHIYIPYGRRRNTLLPLPSYIVLLPVWCLAGSVAHTKSWGRSRRPTLSSSVSPGCSLYDYV